MHNTIVSQIDSKIIEKLNKDSALIKQFEQKGLDPSKTSKYIISSFIMPSIVKPEQSKEKNEILKKLILISLRLQNNLNQICHEDKKHTSKLKKTLVHLGLLILECVSCAAICFTIEIFTHDMHHLFAHGNNINFGSITSALYSSFQEKTTGFIIVAFVILACFFALHCLTHYLLHSHDHSHHKNNHKELEFYIDIVDIMSKILKDEINPVDVELIFKDEVDLIKNLNEFKNEFKNFVISKGEELATVNLVK